ncbi:serine hydrolase [Hyphococcus flavus]|uniref:Serine hydrolase n=1 Tax=Hyphococcus flavus TaxID=1866326 RepID=A0AAF0CDQ8_9PROT|nr:serine hydrolase domain-containing protein [Hyphococcus flavus]WDI30101.1 serine hydrolase [Hyphococcus flavus]
MKLLKLSFVVLGALTAIAVWSAFTVFVGFYGWWMKPVAPEDGHAAFFAEATRMIDEFNLGNTAFILIEAGETVGEYYARAERAVDENTIFPTSSFSKWITAIGVMSLVEEGRIDLDDAVSSHMTRWNLPDGPFNEDDVTVRRLLSHTAGLTDGLGFGDYEASETLPTLEQSLSHPRASSGRDVEITVGSEPGKEFAYSGGGYLILQLVIEEVSGQDYQSFIEGRLLKPLEMNRSSFNFIGDIEEATGSFDPAGNPAPQYKYAAAGATGFSTSAADLMRLVHAVATADPALGLSAEALQSMRAPEASILGSGIWGLGTMLYAPTRSGSDYIYGHDGANEPAINVSVRINPETGDAYVALVNGHPSLASDIGAEWVLWQTGNPDFLSTDRVLKSALLPALIGSAAILILAFMFFRRLFNRSQVSPQS